MTNLHETNAVSQPQNYSAGESASGHDSVQMHDQALSDTISPTTTTVVNKESTVETTRKFPAWNIGERVMGTISTMGQKTITTVGSPIRWAIAKASEGSSEPKVSKREQNLQQAINEKAGEVRRLDSEITDMRQQSNGLMRSWRETGSRSTREAAEKLDGEADAKEIEFNKASGELETLQNRMERAGNKDTYKPPSAIINPFTGKELIKW